MIPHFPENERGPDGFTDLSEVTQPPASRLPGKLIQKTLPLMNHKVLASYSQKGAVIRKELMASLNQSHAEFYFETLDKHLVSNITAGKTNKAGLK